MGSAPSILFTGGWSRGPPELSIQQVALGQMDPTRPMVLARRSVERLGIDVIGATD